MILLRPPARWLLLLVLLPLLAACALTRPPSPISILAPEVSLQIQPDWPAVDWSVQVLRPIADQMRDSDRVLVRQSRSRLQVYPGAAWLDTVPEMLQSKMIRALADGGQIGGVGRGGGLRTRYSLVTELRHFEAVSDGNAGLRVELAIQALLIHQRSGRPVAFRVFEHEARADGQGVDALVSAFEQALSEWMNELVGWVLLSGTAADVEREDSEGEQERRWRQR